MARLLEAPGGASWRAMARAVTSVPQPLNKVPIALTQPMINPATARVWAFCEEEVESEEEEEEEAMTGGEEAVPVPEEAVPVPEEAVPVPEEAVPRIMKRPMRTTTRMPVIIPNITKARFHARNRPLRRSLCSEPSKLVLSG